MKKLVKPTALKNVRKQQKRRTIKENLIFV